MRAAHSFLSVAAFLDIGPSSVVVLPEQTAGGNTEKIMQNLGRVLYSVKPRKTCSFAVDHDHGGGNDDRNDA